MASEIAAQALRDIGGDTGSGEEVVSSVHQSSNPQSTDPQGSPESQQSASSGSGSPQEIPAEASRSEAQPDPADEVEVDNEPGGVDITGHNEDGDDAYAQDGKATSSVAESSLKPQTGPSKPADQESSEDENDIDNEPAGVSISGHNEGEDESEDNEFSGQDDDEGENSGSSEDMLGSADLAPDEQRAGVGLEPSGPAASSSQEAADGTSQQTSEAQQPTANSSEQDQPQSNTEEGKDEEDDDDSSVEEDSQDSQVPSQGTSRATTVSQGDDAQAGEDEEDEDGAFDDDDDNSWGNQPVPIDYFGDPEADNLRMNMNAQRPRIANGAQRAAQRANDRARGIATAPSNVHFTTDPETGITTPAVDPVPEYSFHNSMSAADARAQADEQEEYYNGVNHLYNHGFIGPYDELTNDGNVAGARAENLRDYANRIDPQDDE
jgi:hypothetical protein